MNVEEVKIEVHDYVDRLDERFLKVIHSMLDTYFQEEKEAIIGYDIEGNPKTASKMQSIYDAEVDAAVNDGKHITLEELKDKSATWLNNTK